MAGIFHMSTGSVENGNVLPHVDFLVPKNASFLCL